MPIISEVIEASEEKPYLGLLLEFEMPVVRELLSREEIPPAPSNSPAMATGETTPEMLDAFCRLVGLLDKPRDIPFFSGLIQREMIYRILQAPAGARLRAIATLGDQSNQTAKQLPGPGRTTPKRFGWRNSRNSRAWAYPRSTTTSGC